MLKFRVPEKAIELVTLGSENGWTIINLEASYENDEKRLVLTLLRRELTLRLQWILMPPPRYQDKFVSGVCYLSLQNLHTRQRKLRSAADARRIIAS